MPVPRVSAELQSIQALRAVAASSVILVHIPFVGRGTFGVDIFFVISGFIICYISSLNADDFLLKRIFRIVPLYWLGTCGVFLVALLMPTLLNATTANLTNLAKSLFLIPYRREDGSVFPMLFLGWDWLIRDVLLDIVFGLALAFFKRWASLAASRTLCRGGCRPVVWGIFNFPAFLFQSADSGICIWHGCVRHLEAIQRFIVRQVPGRLWPWHLRFASTSISTL